MKENEKVVYLTDYIETQELITTSDSCKPSIDLAEPNGNLVKKGISFCIDILVIGVLNAAISGAYAIYVDAFLSPLNYSNKVSLIRGNMLLHASVFISLYFAYFLYSTYVLHGKTLGKMTMGLRVISEKYVLDIQEDKYALSLDNSLRRALGYVICYLSFGTFFVFNFSSEDRRGLADYMSNSRTVSDDWLAQSIDFRNYSRKQIQINIRSLDIKKSA